MIEYVSKMDRILYEMSTVLNKGIVTLGIMELNEHYSSNIVARNVISRKSSMEENPNLILE